MPAEVLAAHIAASRLCHDMGDSFKNERKRSVVFDSCVVGLFEKWDKEHVLQPEKSRRFGKADRVILEDNVVIAIREGKWEAGYGGSDVYMQIARDYDLLVKVLIDSSHQLSQPWSTMLFDLCSRHVLSHTDHCIDCFIFA